MSTPPASAAAPSMAGLFWTVVLCVTGSFGATGGMVGLAVGLAAYPPTAWAAVFELGIPATVVGFVLALPCGAAAVAIRARSWSRSDRNLRH